MSPVFPPSGPLGPGQSPTSGGAVVTTYQGPGDIASGWIIWCGMRAFSAASAATGTTKAIRLVFTGGFTKDYYTQANGTIDLSSYAADLLAHPGAVYVNAWYDQSGNGNDMLPVTTAGAFTVNAQGTFPGITFTGAGGYQHVGVTTYNQPLGSSIVANITSGAAPGTEYDLLTNTAGAAVAYHNSAGVHSWYIYAGGSNSESINNAPGSFRAANATLNGTSSHLYFDGTDVATGADVGTQSAGTSLRLGSSMASSNLLNGVVLEWGVNSGSLVSVASALNSNQHGSTYGYGF